jgi:hypothetical protein
MLGAAIAVLMSYFAMSVYIYIVSQKFYPVKIAGKIMLLMLLNLLAFALFYADFSLHIPIYLSIVIALVLCAISISISVVESKNFVCKKNLCLKYSSFRAPCSK